MIDLQLHTTDSDGTWPWDRVLNTCVEMDLTAFAITDHDTVVRCDQIRAWGKERNVMAIPGIEMSTKEKGQTVHLLGYFLDGPMDVLQEKLGFLKKARVSRNKQIIQKLREMDYDVTEEEVKRISGEGTMGRPHIARLLLQKGYVNSMKEAFNRFLGIHGLAYFPKEELPLPEALGLLHQAGAVTSVAHPILLDRSPEELENALKEWKSWGLDGVEGIYPSYTAEQTSFMDRMAKKFDLILTGGSDFHGENKPHIKIGVGTGTLNVPDALLEPLLKKREEVNRAIGVKAL